MYKFLATVIVVYVAAIFLDAMMEKESIARKSMWIAVNFGLLIILLQTLFQ